MQETKFITPTEEYFMECGVMKNLQSLIAKRLKKNFPGVAGLTEQIDSLVDIAKLDAIFETTYDETNLETWRKRVEEILAQPVA